MSINYSNIIMLESGGIFGSAFSNDMSHIEQLYEFYNGRGQLWSVPKDLAYKPSRIITNYTKKLIDDEVRFIFGNPPQITIKAKDKADDDKAKIINDLVQQILESNSFKGNLIKAAKDCFVGKRVAIKLWNDKQKVVQLMFRTSLEFIYETELDDADKLSKIIFFYQVNNEIENSKQRIWKQKFELINGRCYLNQGIYNGFGTLIEEIYINYDTGLDFIPAKVIINDGLTGDMYGDSDVEGLIDNQNEYNHLKSDDQDALKFGTYSQTVFTNVSEKSLKNIQIAPGFSMDVQPEDPDKPVEVKILERNFSYGERLENAIDRIIDDMYNLLCIPNMTTKKLQGVIPSGKAMNVLYRGLISRGEEKWCAWEPALKWMINTIIKMVKIYNIVPLPDIDYSVEIRHIYNLVEDEESERKEDLEEVKNGVVSRHTFITKWSAKWGGIEPDVEYKRTLEEKQDEVAIEQGAVVGDINE